MRKAHPLLSIIIPIYNAEEYLRDCLRSIVNQSFTQYELILIDDGSSDRSKIICNEFIQDFEKVDIRYIYQKNQGVSAARNLGLSEAHGKYVTFVDSDDQVYSDMYEHMMLNLTKNNADLIMCKYNIDNQRNSINVDDFQISHDNKKILDLCIDTSFSSFGTSLWNKIIKKEIVTSNNIQLDDTLSIGEDMVFLFEIIMKSKTFVYTNNEYYYYYQNVNGAVNQKFSSKKLSTINAHEKAFKIIENADSKYEDILKRRCAENCYYLLVQASNAKHIDKNIVRELQKRITTLRFIEYNICHNIKNFIYYILLTKNVYTFNAIKLYNSIKKRKRQR